jgi:hypothetical protein
MFIQKKITKKKTNHFSLHKKKSDNFKPHKIPHKVVLNSKLYSPLEVCNYYMNISTHWLHNQQQSNYIC